VDVATRIKQLRENLGLSQNELARRAGIRQSSLSYIESGDKNPSVDTLLRICSALGLTLAEFFAEGGLGELDPDLRQLLREAERLTPEQRKKLVEFLKSLKGGVV